MSAPTIREATVLDAGPIAAIYAWHVLNGVATFEETPPDSDDMRERLSVLVSGGYPLLVACLGDDVIGYAYAGPHKLRSAYRFTVEDTVYLHRDFRGKGVGGALLGALVNAASARGFRQMIAVIGDSGNAASIALHRGHGFRHIGVAHRLGFKFGREWDVVYMQRALSPAPAASIETPVASL